MPTGFVFAFFLLTMCPLAGTEARVLVRAAQEPESFRKTLLLRFMAGSAMEKAIFANVVRNWYLCIHRVDINRFHQKLSSPS
jgi:hypothetical protein